MSEQLTPAQVKAQFTARRALQWAVGGIACAALWAYAVFFPWTGQGLVVAYLLFAAFIVAYARLGWRCPACSSFLGILWWSGPKQCARCGVELMPVAAVGVNGHSTDCAGADR